MTRIADDFGAIRERMAEMRGTADTSPVSIDNGLGNVLPTPSFLIEMVIVEVDPSGVEFLPDVHVGGPLVIAKDGP